eukprot:TRINITY_DN9358_c0_g2_i2.p1 TRINITY_DN9358_c0_g2~~TRINITY_DN9358_c0_g2_i2.p1  ORF type:complete len:485 (-),score=78.81 TRINITY_DN9358_c0_g2_i2:16-1470(-)
MDKKDSKMGLRLHSLKALIQHSYLDKPRAQINAILSPLPTSTTLRYSLGERLKGKNEIAALMTKYSEQKMAQTKDSQSTNEYTETLSSLPAGKPFSAIKTIGALPSELQNCIRCNLLENYKKSNELYSLESINKIIYNDNSHVVALFKDFLIYEDAKELLLSYNLVQSKHLLPRLTRECPARLVLSTYLVSQTRAAKQAAKRRDKVRKLKAEDGGCGDESTLFRADFLDSLAKDDLSNSASALPAISLEDSRSKEMEELLNEFSNNSNSDSEEESIKEHEEPIPLNRRITEGVTGKRHVMTANYRNPKIFSSNGCYDGLSRDKPRVGVLLIKSLDKFLLKGSGKLRNRTLARLLTDARSEVKTYDAEKDESSSPEVEHQKNYFNIYAKKFKNAKDIFGCEDNKRIFSSPLNKEKKFNLLFGEKERGKIVLSVSTKFKDELKTTLRKDELKEIAPRVATSTPLSLIHICRCRRLLTCRSRWSPYH